MRFLSKRAVLAIHDSQIGEHGGPIGVRDEGLLESALARPENKHAYGVEDVFALAAAYAYGIARDHPFLDGNKRSAWVTCRTFLHLNGVPLMPDRVEAVERMVQLAEGSLAEEPFGDWLRQLWTKPQ